MADDFDLLVKNAKLRSGPQQKEIGIEGDTITRIGESIGEGRKEIDARGNLVTESFVDPHLHMCKVYTLQMAGEDSLKLYQDEEGEMGGAMNAIELASRVKEQYDESWIYENAKKALKLGVKHGVLHHRAFADTDTKAGLEAIKALLRLRDEFEGVVDLQVVAFPQDGVVRDPGSADLVEEAVEMGADTVGGIPWIEYTDDDASEHIDRMFDIAVENDRDVAMLTDDAGDPGLRTTEELAVRTLEEGWEGRVTACHARAMETYPEPYFRKLSTLLGQAEMSVVSDPQTGPLHAKVDELLENGVNVALGQDDIADAYYPYGRNSMLEVGFLASHLLWKTTFGEMDEIYDMITVNGAESMNIENYGLREECEANLVVLNQDTVYEALMYQDAPAYVISSGEVVAQTESETRYDVDFS
ncbi:MAG: amidohydrolase family protein [Halobacteria archaeon]|nr:amidohydrolase family protein [Halobacteria archaeon]